MEFVKVKTRRPPIGGVDFDYKIGSSIDIHSHINNENSWYLSCGLLNVHQKAICSKSSTELDIRIAVRKILSSKLLVLQELIKDVEEL